MSKADGFAPHRLANFANTFEFVPRTQHDAITKRLIQRYAQKIGAL